MKIAMIDNYCSFCKKKLNYVLSIESNVKINVCYECYMEQIRIELVKIPIKEFYKEVIKK